MEASKGSAARVGFVIFIATIVIVVAVYMVGDGGGIFASYSTYVTYFPSTGGLYTGARVFVNGVPVGKVIDIRFPQNREREKVKVTVGIDLPVAGLIREDSKAWIGSQGLLGDKQVNIEMGKANVPALPPGSEIPGVERATIAEMVPEKLLENVTKLLEEINSGKGTIGMLLKDEELYENIKKFSSSLNITTQESSVIARDMKEIIREVREQKGTLGKLIFSEEYAQEFGRLIGSANRLIENLALAVEPLAKGEGAIGKLLRDESLHGDLKSALASLSSVAARLDGTLKAIDEKKSLLGRAIHDPAMGRDFEGLVTNLERSAVRLESILTKIDDGQGSAGAFVNDPSIAGSIRNVFVGVQEWGYLSNIIQNAEEEGRRIRLDQLAANRILKDELERARSIEAPPVPDGRTLPVTGKDAEGGPVPLPGTPPGDAGKDGTPAAPAVKDGKDGTSR